MLSALPLSGSFSANSPRGDAPRGRIAGWEGPAGRRDRAGEPESVPARRPSGAGQREPPERQRRRRRRRRQHPPRAAPALGVAAAGRHECYYSERRCRSIALSQWQGATGLILRAVRGVHLSPAASPPPSPRRRRRRRDPRPRGSGREWERPASGAPPARRRGRRGPGTRRPPRAGGRATRD
ncbi:serine/arginine repetitive matrix protein 3-like [Leopardus geoffroyi]|uniref:serine/arginine repetitive matrix protein 3-like n=1 Tax=Leopardus geoffroyi TaxID=46844 RepID=UPI001E26256E|nr:serine/arginine repetitive matrix protein 3-like [Leopardus geoffroyi]